MSLTIFIHLFGLSAEPNEGHTVCQKLLLASVKGAIIDSAGPNDLAVGGGSGATFLQTDLLVDP